LSWDYTVRERACVRGVCMFARNREKEHKKEKDEKMEERDRD
jgi:hypothetical protein